MMDFSLFYYKVYNDDFCPVKAKHIKAKAYAYRNGLRDNKLKPVVK